MDKHVGKVVWPNFVLDSIAVCIAYTVVTLTVGTLLEHVANDFLPDANSVILQVAIAGFNILLAVQRLPTSNA